MSRLQKALKKGRKDGKKTEKNGKPELEMKENPSANSFDKTFLER